MRASSQLVQEAFDQTCAPVPCCAPVPISVALFGIRNPPLAIKQLRLSQQSRSKTI